MTPTTPARAKHWNISTSAAVDTGRMITHTFKFDQVLEAYELHHMQDEGAVKIVIDMEG